MTGLENYLNEVEGQEAQEEKLIQTVRNPVLDLLCKKYLEYLRPKKINPDTFKGDLYLFSLDLIEKIEYTAKDVENFSILLKKYEKHPFFFISGVFLSALINQSKEDKLQILLSHLNERLSSIGRNNVKQLTVIGSTGSLTGCYMVKGQIFVKGNAGMMTGLCSEGGEIYVNGEIKSIEENCKARVYQRGNLIWPV